jgi:hypothetical protein
MFSSVNSLEDRKRELLEQSENYRREIAIEIRNVKASLFWVPQTVQTIRTVSPFLVWGAPLLGILIGRRITRKPRPEEAKNGKHRGLLTTVIGGIALYHKVKPLINFVVPLLRNAARKSNGATTEASHSRGAYTSASR